MEIKLTPRQIEALLMAITITEGSYAGWSKAEMGKETVADLKHLANIEAKLIGGGN